MAREGVLLFWEEGPANPSGGGKDEKDSFKCVHGRNACHRRLWIGSLSDVARRRQASNGDLVIWVSCYSIHVYQQRRYRKIQGIAGRSVVDNVGGEKIEARS